jgi:hypothetical protein
MSVFPRINARRSGIDGPDFYRQTGNYRKTQIFQAKLA